MSHITKIKTELKDGDVLRKALRKLGYDLREGGVVTGGYRRERGKDVEILATKGILGIGFKRSESDHNPYEIIADWDGSRKKQKKIVNNIYQTYSQEKVVKAARSRGYSIIMNHTNQNGQIEIVLRKVA